MSNAENTPPDPIDWVAFVKSTIDVTNTLSLRTQAWDAGFRAQSEQARLERLAGEDTMVPEGDLVDPSIMLRFLRAAEAGKYVGQGRVLRFGQTAWNCWAK